MLSRKAVMYEVPGENNLANFIVEGEQRYWVQSPLTDLPDR